MQNIVVQCINILTEEIATDMRIISRYLTLSTHIWLTIL